MVCATDEKKGKEPNVNVTQPNFCSFSKSSQVFFLNCF